MLAGACEQEMTWNLALRMGRMGIAAVAAGICVNAIADFARADDEDDDSARVRSRTESLTLVDTIDLDRWRPETLAVSPDGARMAYARFDRPSIGHIVLDGKAGPSYAALVGKPVFSLDGKRVAYVAMNTQNQWFVVVDGEESRERYPPVQGRPGVFPDLRFSLDGRRLAYVAVVDGGGVAKQVVVVDHQADRKYDEIAGLALAPKGESTAYAARTGRQWAVVVDGKEGPRHDWVLATTPVFSPDGRHVAYGGKEGRRYFVAVDGKRGRDYDDLSGALLFSPDSTKMVYSPSVGRRRAVVINEEEIGLYEHVDESSFVFSPKGQHLAFKAGDANSWFVVVDGNKGRGYRGVGRPVFAPDGRVAHAACDRCGGGVMEEPEMFVVVDGRRVGVAYADIADPIVFSGDGRAMGFVARRGASQFVVVDETGQRSYASVVAQSLAFSPSGRDLVYAATNAAGRQVVAVSGLEGTAFDAVWLRGLDCPLPLPLRCSVRFDGDRSFSYLVRLRERVYLVQNSARGP